MRIYFKNENFINRSTKLIKSILKSELPKLSTNKLRNAICKAYGYQHLTDLQKFHNEKPPTIDEVLINKKHRESIEATLLASIMQMLENDYKVEHKKAQHFANEAMELTKYDRLYLEFEGLTEGYYEFERLPSKHDEPRPTPLFPSKNAFKLAFLKLLHVLKAWNGVNGMELVQPLRIASTLEAGYKEYHCNDNYFSNELHSQDIFPPFFFKDSKTKTMIEKLDKDNYFNETVCVAIDKAGLMIEIGGSYVEPGESFNVFHDTVEDAYNNFYEIDE